MEVDHAVDGTVGAAPPRGPLLNQLSVDDRSALLRLGTERTFERGAVLIQEGDLGTDVYVLVSGCAKVVGNTPDGRTTLLAVRVGGDIVGEVALIDGGPRLATVIAAASKTVVRVIAGSRFRGVLAERPMLSAAVQRAVVGKLRMATRHRVDTGADPVIARLARVILHLCEVYGRITDQGILIDVSLSQRDLASLIGAAEPSVHRALAELRGRGAITTDSRYRQQVIIDIDHLVAATVAGSS